MDLNNTLVDLINEQKYDEALTFFLKNNVVFLKHDFINAVRTHCELLLVLKKYNDIDRVLSNYSDYPYISQEVEEFLRDYPSHIKELIYKSIKSDSSYEIDEKLFYSTKEEDLFNYVNQIISKNLINRYKENLKFICQNAEYKNKYICFLCLTALISIDYDETLNIPLNGGKTIFKPSKEMMPFSNDDKEFYSLLDYCTIDEKDITLSSLTRDYLTLLVVSEYPNKLNKLKKENIKKAINNLIDTSFSSLPYVEDNFEVIKIENIIKSMITY